MTEDVNPFKRTGRRIKRKTKAAYEQVKIKNWKKSKIIFSARIHRINAKLLIKIYFIASLPMKDWIINKIAL